MTLPRTLSRSLDARVCQWSPHIWFFMMKRIHLTFHWFYLKLSPSSSTLITNLRFFFLLRLFFCCFVSIWHFDLQKPNSLSPSTMLMVPTRLMPLILAMYCEHSTPTQLWLISRNWAAQRNVVKNCCHLKNSCQSTLKWKRTKNKVATKISLNVSNCTTKMRTVWCCSLNWTTLCSLWVSSICSTRDQTSPNIWTFFNLLNKFRWMPRRRPSCNSLQGLHARRKRWRWNQICP